jgi:hypothetical protein
MSKIIVVPKNRKTEIALDYDAAASEQLVELYLTDDEFDRLWNMGVFTLINRISNCIIDDFEDEHITDLNLIFNTLNELKKILEDSEEIIEMFELSLLYKTSIHFYF